MIRFTNSDVTENFEAGLEAILATASAARRAGFLAARGEKAK